MKFLKFLSEETMPKEAIKELEMLLKNFMEQHKMYGMKEYDDEDEL